MTAPVPGACAHAWSRADAEAGAACALVQDPGIRPCTVQVHLVRGMRALQRVAAAAPAEVAGAAGVDPEELSTRLAALQEAESRWDSQSEDGEPGPAPDQARAPLRREVAWLADAVRSWERALYGQALRRAARRRWVRGATIFATVAVPATLALAYTVPTVRDGPWRGAYYATPDRSGPPKVRRDGDVRYRWAESAPLPGLPRDGFSVQWDTCLRLEAPLEIAFRLTSDDGARLLVGGVRVVDNWGAHGSRTRGSRVSLAAGVHHLRVLYYDERQAAEVTLTASLYGERPDALPARLLHYPGDTLEDPEPCKHVDRGD